MLREASMLALAITMCSCQSGSLDSDLEPGVSDIVIPYFMLARQDWVDYKPEAVAESISAEIAKNGSAKCHDSGVVSAANMTTNTLTRLRPATRTLPVKGVTIELEKAIVKTDVVLDSEGLAKIGITPVAAATAKGEAYYAFSANLNRYTATYEVSLTTLLGEGILNNQKPETLLDRLAGLPTTYYALDNLDIRSARAFEISASAGGGWGPVELGASSDVELRRSSNISFQRKVFAVDFLRDGRYSSREGLIRVIKTPPLILAETRLADSTEEHPEEFAASPLRFSVKIPPNDPEYPSLAGKSYELRVLVEPNGTTRSSVHSKPYSEKIRSASGPRGNPVAITADAPSLLPRVNIGKKITPYNSVWFYMDRQGNVSFAWVSDAWLDWRSFVRFVE